MSRYNAEVLRRECVDTLQAYGLNAQDADIVADSMLEADAAGISTHGIRMLPAYIDRLKSGVFSKDDISIIDSSESFSVVNANAVIGAVSAVKCIDIAIEKARRFGVHSVFSYNANTFGAASYYASRAAKNNMIGFACSNSPAAMPASNGIQPMLGTNPFAFACPTGSYGLVIVDMATSVVAKSKFEAYRQQGLSLPDGWALDASGSPTNDPVEGIKGLVLPMAGFKGYGIAMMIDIIAGLLSGAGYLTKVNKFYSDNMRPMNVGHFFCVIDPAMVFRGDFLKEMDQYVELIKSSKRVEGTDIIIPGDRRKKKREIAEHEGIELQDETIEKLKNVLVCGKACELMLEEKLKARGGKTDFSSM